ncbi:MAG: hypothetical protein RLZZ331_1577 [Pseudomonadota bacterium]
MAQDGLTVSNEAGVMTITLDRPEKLNAYTDAMGRALARAVRAASEDDAIRAIIITGAGRAFCAGADVSAGAESFDMAGEGAGNFGAARRGTHDSFIHALFESKKPIIAAINGPAVGVGITLTLPCDVRIAAEGARIMTAMARIWMAAAADILCTLHRTKSRKPRHFGRSPSIMLNIICSPIRSDATPTAVSIKTCDTTGMAASRFIYRRTRR